MGITEDIINDRLTIRELTQNFKGFQEKVKKRVNNIWMEERRKKQSIRGKNNWNSRKEVGSKKGNECIVLFYAICRRPKSKEREDKG